MARSTHSLFLTSLLLVSTNAPVRAQSQVLPVIYSQTRGVQFIGYDNRTPALWCNTTVNTTVSWFLNGIKLDDKMTNSRWEADTGIIFYSEKTDTGSYLQIEDAKRNLVGQVQCRVSNHLASTLGDIITVMPTVFQRVGSPQIDIGIKAHNDHVTLPCNIHIKQVPANPSQWFYRLPNGTDVTIDDRQDVFCNMAREVCVVLPTNKYRSEVFRCVVHRKGFNSLSVTYNIYKNDSQMDMDMEFNPPIHLLYHVSSERWVSVRFREDVLLQCVFTGCYPINIKWKFQKSADQFCDPQSDQFILPSTKHHFFREGMMLKISDVNEGDLGHYICMADCGYDLYSHHIQLVTIPVLTKQIDVIYSTTGKTIYVNCSISQGSGPLAVTWWRNHEQLIHDGFTRHHLQSDGKVLVIDDAAFTDTSTIMCNVSNTAGYAIGYRPIIITGAGDLESLTQDYGNSDVTTRQTEQLGGLLDALQHPTVHDRIEEVIMNVIHDKLSVISQGRISSEHSMDIVIQNALMNWEQLERRLVLVENRLQQLHMSQQDSHSDNSNSLTFSETPGEQPGSADFLKYIQHHLGSMPAHTKLVVKQVQVHNGNRTLSRYECNDDTGCYFTSSIAFNSSADSPSKYAAYFILPYTFQDVRFHIRQKCSYDSQGVLSKVIVAFSTVYQYNNSRCQDRTILEILNQDHFVPKNPSVLKLSILYKNPFVSEENAVLCPNWTPDSKILITLPSNGSHIYVTCLGPPAFRKANIILVEEGRLRPIHC